MQYSVIMGHGNMLRQKQAPGNIPGNLPRNIIALGGCQSGILVGIFLRQLLVFIPDQFQNRFVRGIGLTQKASLIAINDVLFGKHILILFHQSGLDHILYMLHGQLILVLCKNSIQNLIDQLLAGSVLFLHLIICLADRCDDLFLLKRHNTAIPLLDLGNAHFYASSLIGICTRFCVFNLNYYLYLVSLYIYYTKKASHNRHFPAGNLYFYK